MNYCIFFVLNCHLLVFKLKMLDSVPTSLKWGVAPLCLFWSPCPFICDIQEQVENKNE